MTQNEYRKTSNADLEAEAVAEYNERIRDEAEAAKSEDDGEA